MADSKVILPDNYSDEGRGPWITTFSGRHYHYLTPRPEDIDIMDIGVSLSREGRFAGHCTEYYSVAQHSVHASELMEAAYKVMIDECDHDGRGIPGLKGIQDLHDRYLGPLEDVGPHPRDMDNDRALALIGMAGELHDGSETYMKDIPSPLKRLLPRYGEIEDMSQKAIFDKYLPGLVWDKESPLHDFINTVDKRLLVTEAASLIRHKEDWIQREWTPYDMKIYAWAPDKACVNFMARYYELKARI